MVRSIFWFFQNLMANDGKPSKLDFSPKNHGNIKKMAFSSDFFKFLFFQKFSFMTLQLSPKYHTQIIIPLRVSQNNAVDTLSQPIYIKPIYIKPIYLTHYKYNIDHIISQALHSLYSSLQNNFPCHPVKEKSAKTNLDFCQFKLTHCTDNIIHS